MRWHSLRQFGHNGLGPIVAYYLHRLHAHLRQCGGEGDRILFALRAGVRIEALYRLWLGIRKAEPPANAVLFRTSRMLAIKACYAAAPSMALTALGREMGNASLDEALNSLLRHEIARGRAAPVSGLPAVPIHLFLQGDDAVARLARSYLDRQSELFAAYLARLGGGAERLVLVDSGWRGTIQLLLETAFPDRLWEGLYFGCTGRVEIFGRRPRHVHGLVFDAESFDPEKPETAFVLHRHLIESLFEPGILSVEEIRPEDFGAGFTALRPAERRVAWDDVHDGVTAYVATHAAEPPSKTVRAYHAAMERIAAMIAYPTAEDVGYASGKARSLDLGRAGEIAAVVPATDRFAGDSADLRIRQAIWRTGQAALEHGGARREMRQREIVGAASDARPATVPATARGIARGHVAVITRTKDRPVLLKRAAESVAAQSHQNLSWIVVNDGGHFETVREVVEACPVDPARITLLSHAESLGMEAASNAGIRASKSDHIVIHDDDDSWHPEFLEESVAFLESTSLYDGVVAHSLYVSEEIVGESVVERGRWPYHDWVRTVQIQEMLAENFFPPIAFLFRRSAFDALGGFDETLPVLGDWDFNIRFLLRADIGVLPHVLAFYHHRDGAAGAYANSVTASKERHAAVNAVLRNRYIRRGARNGDSGALATLMGLAFTQADTRHRLGSLERAIGTPREPGTAALARIDSALSPGAGVRGDDWAEADKRWVMINVLVGELMKSIPALVSPADALWRLRSFVESNIQAIPVIPPDDFDEAAYVAAHPDIRASLQRGEVTSGYEHYVRHGMREGRRRPSKDRLDR